MNDFTTISKHCETEYLWWEKKLGINLRIVLCIVER